MKNPVFRMNIVGSSMDHCTKKYVITYNVTPGYRWRTVPGDILEYIVRVFPPYYTNILVTRVSHTGTIAVYVKFWKQIHVTYPWYAHFNVLYDKFGLKLVACDTAGSGTWAAMYRIWDPLFYAYYAIDDQSGTDFIKSMRLNHGISDKIEWMLEHPAPYDTYYTSDKHKINKRACYEMQTTGNNEMVKVHPL